MITDIDEISGKAGDKCQDDTANATTSSISAPTPSQAYSNVDLCNTTSATTPEPGSETSAFLAQPPCSVDDDDDDELLRPPAAINPSLDQQKVDNLSMLFPRIPRDVIRNAVVTCASMNTAVNGLLQYGEFDHDINPSSSSDNISNIETQENPPQTVGSLPFVLQKLRRKMKSRGMREKLKVDPINRWQSITVS